MSVEVDLCLVVVEKGVGVVELVGSIGTGGSIECCDGVDIGVVGVKGVDCG